MSIRLADRKRQRIEPTRPSSARHHEPHLSQAARAALAMLLAQAPPAPQEVAENAADEGAEARPIRGS